MCFDTDSEPPVPRIAGAAVSHDDLTLTAADGNTFAAFLATPDEPAATGVVILPDVRGLYRFYEELALRFAERGHAAIAIDYFGRTAGPEKRDDTFAYAPHVEQTTDDGVQADTRAAVERLRERGARSIFVVGTRLMTKKDSGVQDFNQLAGKNVVTTAGTTSERLLRKMNEEKKLGMNIISAKDHGESFLTLETGRAVAFMMDDALLYGELAKAKKPGDWTITGTPQSYEAYGCMLAKDDAAFKKVVDSAIAKTMSSGEAEKIYNKWFLAAIPPKNINLGFPMSDAMKKLFKAPNDRPFE